MIGYRAALARTPHYIVRARDQTLSLFVRKGGLPAAVASGTITIRDGDGELIVNADPIAVGSDGEATYPLLATSVPDTLEYSCKWSVDWDLVFADGGQLFPRSAFLLRRELPPAIDASIIGGDGSGGDTEASVGRHDDLVSGGVITLQQIQGHVNEAWDDIQGWLIEDGHPPQKALSSEGLAEMHADWSCHRMFANLATLADGDPGYASERDRYGKAAKDKYGRLQLAQDADQDGTADGTTDNVIPLYGVPEHFRGLVS